MTLFISSLGFPAVLCLLALGCGLLVERAAGARFQGVLLLPAGLALVVVVAQLATMADATAELATPAVVVLAAVGLVLSPPWRRGSIDPWALGSAAVVFAIFVAPVLFSGQATFGGYAINNDSSTWLALTDHAMEHGRSLGGLSPSSYRGILKEYLDTGYPLGAFLPVGVGRPLVGQDVAWLFQPYMALSAAMLALALYALVSRVVESRALRALVITVASQGALLFGYAFFGEFKELPWTLALSAAFVAPILLRGELLPSSPQNGVPASRTIARARPLLPLALASAATLAIFSVGGGVWLAPLLVPALVAIGLKRGRQIALRDGAIFALLTAVLAIPSIVTAVHFVDAAGTVLTAKTDLGTLLRPLSPLQMLGIWPSTDFRERPDLPGLAYPLIVLVAVAGIVGLVSTWRRRSLGLLVYVGAALVGCLIVAVPGSPWTDAKAFTIASPACLLVAMVGIAAVLEHRPRREATTIAAVAAVAIAAGVLWSNALAYHGMRLAPHDRMAELKRIGERIDGEGPTFMNEYEPYATRHFLRDATADSPGEYRPSRPSDLQGGQKVRRFGSVDVDDLQQSELLAYRTLVVRRSPRESRPPSAYRLTWRGRYYDVWQRPQGPPPTNLLHLSLRQRSEPVARPPCGVILRAARFAGSNGRLAAVPRGPSQLVQLAQAAHPADWKPDIGISGAILPSGSGTMQTALRVPRQGPYGIWVGGSFRGRIELSLQGQSVGAISSQLNQEQPYYAPAQRGAVGLYTGRFTAIVRGRLHAGTYNTTLRYKVSDLRPGSGGKPFPLGPLVLAPEASEDSRIVYVPTRRARTLCGKALDWVEGVR